VTPEYAIYQGDACELIRAIPATASTSAFTRRRSRGSTSSPTSTATSPTTTADVLGALRLPDPELLRVTMPGRLHSVIACSCRCPRSGTATSACAISAARSSAPMRTPAGSSIPRSASGKTRWSRSSARSRSGCCTSRSMKDSTISGQGLADYIVTFRKPGDNPNRRRACSIASSSAPASTSAARAYRPHAARIRADGREPWPFESGKSILVWQRYASPVWMDINQTRTLQYRGGRDEKDEVHISPLQLDVIERCIDLWSQPRRRDGADAVPRHRQRSLRRRRNGPQGIGFELKPSYFHPRRAQRGAG
jgi:hypothetical protein